MRRGIALNQRLVRFMAAALLAVGLAWALGNGPRPAPARAARPVAGAPRPPLVLKCTLVLPYYYLKGATLTGCRVRGNWRGRSMRGATFRHCDLGQARLDGADLRDAQFDADTAWPAGFDPTMAGAVSIEAEG